MIDDWPDESRFMDTMSIGLMLSESARVRVFQEMTSLLWTQATLNAAIHVEELLNKLIAAKPIKLLCAYQLARFSGKEGRQFQDLRPAPIFERSKKEVLAAVELSRSK